MRRRADRLDPASREARLKSGKIRHEIQLSIADSRLLDAFAARHGLTRSGAVARCLSRAISWEEDLDVEGPAVPT